MKRRLLAVLLSCTMLLGLMSAGVAAAETADTYDMDALETEVLDEEAWEELDPEDPAWNTAPRLYMNGNIPEDFSEAAPRALKNGETLRRGIDVSQWQGNIDWKAVANSGIEFAIIRVGGRYSGSGELFPDNTYRYNFTEAKKYGIRVGAYIFSQAITVQEAVEEAQYAASLLKNAGITLDLPLVFDSEFVNNAGRLYDAHLSKQAYTDVTNAFCVEAERLGYDSMVYGSASKLYSELDASQLGRVWLAHWTTSTYYTGDYEYWQFSDCGAVPGINAYVDLDFWFDNGPFIDVKKGDWFQPAVSWAYENGIMAGVGDHRFDPTGIAQRAMVVAVLYRALGTPSNASVPFTDVPAGAYYASAVRWAYANGAVAGMTETSFGPTLSIKRQDLVCILYRLSESPKATQSLSAYADVNQIGDYARDAMSWAVEKGLISGYVDGTTRTLNPQGSLTRAELCQIIMKYLT